MYRRDVYHPGLRQFSAPCGGCRKARTTTAVHRSLPTSPTWKDLGLRMFTEEENFASTEPSQSSETIETFTSTNRLPYITTPKGSSGEINASCRTPCVKAVTINSGTSSPRRKQTKTTEVSPYSILPPFVLVETLHPGDAFVRIYNCIFNDLRHHFNIYLFHVFDLLFWFFFYVALIEEYFTNTTYG